MAEGREARWAEERENLRLGLREERASDGTSASEREFADARSDVRGSFEKADKCAEHVSIRRGCAGAVSSRQYELVKWTHSMQSRCM